MIVGSDVEADMFDRCLTSISAYVDGIFITITNSPNTKLQEICNKYGAHVDIQENKFTKTITQEDLDFFEEFSGWKPTMKAGDVIFQFDEARNSNLNFIPDDYQWFFWLDSDDIVRNGKNLKRVADEAMSRNCEALYLNYLYQVELDGEKIKNIIIQHLRERLVRIDGDYRKVYKWIGSIHETLIQQRETKKEEDQRLDIVHLSNKDRLLSALERNLKVLEMEIVKTKGKDPRPLYYLAKIHYDLHTTEDHEKARVLMMAYLSPKEHNHNMSGWREERAQAWEYIAEIYRSKSQHHQSIKCLHNALIEYSQNPNTYFSLGLSHMLIQDYDTARFYTILASQIPPAKSTLVSTPRDIQARAYEVLYNCGIKTNRIDEAWESCKNLKELFPEDAVINQQWNFINATRQIRDVTKDYVSVINYLSNTGERHKLKPLLEAAPSSVSDNPLIQRVIQDVNPPKQWGKDEIAIFCGPQFTPWSPKNLEDPGGNFVGGSEEAVIYAAKELVKQGWKVTVYADPGADSGEYDGVIYEPYYTFNTRDQFNILIYWRGVSLVDQNCKAKKTYLWAHDVLNQVEFTKERVDKLTKIIVLSKAHRKTIPDVADNKIIISSNGYFEHFLEIKPTNNPHWCIYTSSYDRGLQHLLDMWPEIIKEVPDAQLHVFYGWQLFATFYVSNPERMAWMRKINKLMEQPGITNHGRVSQPEMEKWYKQCGVFTYPSHFYEINCISAIKAQLWGAIPVTTKIGALDETVQHGFKVEGDIYDDETKEKYKESLINAFKTDHDLKSMMDWAREKYSWEKIVNQWSQEFKEGL